MSAVPVLREALTRIAAITAAESPIGRIARDALAEADGGIGAGEALALLSDVDLASRIRSEAESLESTINYAEGLGIAVDLRVGHTEEWTLGRRGSHRRVHSIVAQVARKL